jgi:MFS family permease
VAASLAGGVLTDRFTARRVLPIAVLLLALGPLTLASGRSSWLALAMMCVLGIAQGGQSAANSALWAELYGVAHLGAIRALATSLMVFGSALSPVILGWLFDAGVSVDAVALGCAFYAALSSPLMMLALRRGGPPRRPARTPAG